MRERRRQPFTIVRGRGITHSARQFISRWSSGEEYTSAAPAKTSVVLNQKPTAQRTMKSFILILGVAVAAAAQRRPPSYSQEYMPDTSFDCRDKILGGYYADIETDCQMFHVCVKVPGIGVQDFRFLCPNDTSFDQENQICASWYEVNCEPNVLFYSDNFDLYRIGYSPSSPALASSSANPIPLGPSTARPAPARQASARPRPRPQLRPQEEEEEFYLQRSETGDSRLQQGKDLRSSSSNYFGRNKGKEEDYGTDTYLKKTAKPYKPFAQTTAAAPTTFVTDSPTTAAKKKVAVRKLRKRPQQQNDNYQPEDFTTVAAPTAAFSQQANQGSYRGQQNYNAQRNYDYNAVPTTQAPSTADNYNAYTPRYNTIQRNGNSNYQSTTQGSTSFAAYEGSYQQANAQNDYSVNNYNFAQRASSAKPAEYSTTSVPTNNYQTIQRKSPEYSTTTLQTSAPNNYYQGNANAAASSGTYQSTPNYQSSDFTNNKNYNYDFSGAYTSTAAPVSYDQYNYQSAARNTNKPSSNVPVTTAAPAYNSYQTTSEAYKYNNDNYNFQKTAQLQYNAQPSYQSERDVAQGESLKTAQSSNYGPSSFNNYQNTYDSKTNKPATNNYNYTNNYYTSSAAPKSSAFSSAQKSSTANNNAYTTKSTNNYDYSSQQSTASPPKPFSTAYSPTAPVASRLPSASTDYRTPTASPAAHRRTPTSPAPATSTKNLKDVSYDYAYYDETNTEYDGLDPISDHHFGKGKESFKIARSAKR